MHVGRSGSVAAFTVTRRRGATVACKAVWNSFGETGGQLRGIPQNLPILICTLSPSNTVLLTAEWVQWRQPI